MAEPTLKTKKTIHKDLKNRNSPLEKSSKNKIFNAISKEQTPQANPKLSNKITKECAKFSNTFELLSWNLDGLDERFLKLRTHYVIDLIQEKKPGLILLQEVINYTHEILKNKLSSDYAFITPSFPLGNQVPYYCLILVSKKDFTCCQETENTYWYPNTVMGRHLLSVRVNSKSLPHESIQVLTSHLESTYQFSNQRKLQFQEALCYISNTKFEDAAWNTITSIFGGDLNLVDGELKNICLPLQMQDTWEALGRPEDCKYTWDLKLNSNLQSTAKTKARRRFDRIYFYKKDPTTQEVDKESKSYFPFEMSFVGNSIIEACEMFPSDHFGIYIKFVKS